MSTADTSLIHDLAPIDLGLDASKFPTFRDVQYEALEWAVETLEDANVIGCALPQGAGKSAFAVALARLLGRRAVFVTASKGLESQYMEDFGSGGLVDIRGRANYDCGDLAHLDCHDGPKAGCRYAQFGGCAYESAKAAARNAQLVTTNYAMWLGINRGSGGRGLQRTREDWRGDNPVELLVLDEGHEAYRQLAQFVSCQLLQSDLQRCTGYPVGEDIGEWSAWTENCLPSLDAAIKEAEVEIALLGGAVPKKDIDALHKLEALQTKFEKIASADSGDWIVERDVIARYGLKEQRWKFDSVFPGQYAKDILFCNVPKVVVMSATLKPKSLRYLGLSDEEFAFRAWRRIFPPERNPIYLSGCVKPGSVTEDRPLGTLIRIDRNTSEEDKREYVRWIDEQWIGRRLDRKGLIQTNSYAFQEFFMEHSRHAPLMIGNTDDPDSESAWQAAERFRKAEAPAILVSPSFITGWDFPMKACEYVLVVKAPFDERGSKLAKAREARDKDYGFFRAMQTTEQAAMRGMRRFEDQCEVALTDGHYTWFLRQYGRLAQDWFVKAVRPVRDAPKPPPRLA